MPYQQLARELRERAKIEMNKLLLRSSLGGVREDGREAREVWNSRKERKVRVVTTAGCRLSMTFSGTQGDTQPIICVRTFYRGNGAG